MDEASPNRRLVIGMGYIGYPLAGRWRADGAQVTGWVRSDESASVLSREGFSVVIGDVASASNWRNVSPDTAVAIHCASSSRGGPEQYASVFRDGMKQLTTHLPKARLFFVSSTSVYAQTDGEPVTEESPAEPSSETGAYLREAESIALSAGATVLRSAGIYGPGRGVLFRKFLSDEATLEGDGGRWMNQIHRDDLVSAIDHLVRLGVDGGIYNVCDNEPSTHLQYFNWLSEQIGKPLPPLAPVNQKRKRGVTHKKVSNAKLRATGWSPTYPSFREGLMPEIAAWKAGRIPSV